MFHLSRLIQQSEFSGLPNNIVDESTEIRVLGCALGNHTTLMSQLSVFFGGHDNKRPIVKSPKYHVLLQPDETANQQISAFKNPWFFINPLQARNSNSVEKVIQQESPIAERRDMQYWDMREVTLKTDITSSGNIHNLKPLQLLYKQKTLLDHLKQIGAKPRQFSWTTEILANGHIRLTGTSQLYMLKPSAIHPSLISDLSFDD